MMTDAFERRRQAIAEAFPTEWGALCAMNNAYGRLMDFGWRPPIYPIPRGKPIASTVLGSPLIHRGDALWPGASLWKEGWPCLPSDLAEQQDRILHMRLVGLFDDKIGSSPRGGGK